MGLGHGARPSSEEQRAATDVLYPVSDVTPSLLCKALPGFSACHFRPLQLATMRLRHAHFKNQAISKRVSVAASVSFEF